MGEMVLTLFLALWQRLSDRVLVATFTLPDSTAWLLSLTLLGIYAAGVIPFGLWRGFLVWDPVRNWQVIVTAALVAVIFPAVFEEVLFRVLWLPHPSENAASSALWGWSLASLGVFVVSHPLNAVVFFPARRATFFNPIFLTLAGLLGGICTLAYSQSGSLWPPVALHWIIVVIWLLLLGGERRIAGEADKESAIAPNCSR